VWPPRFTLYDLKWYSLFRLKDENVSLRKRDSELKSQIKEADMSLDKARIDLEKCQHEAWTHARRLEREKASLM